MSKDTEVKKPPRVGRGPRRNSLESEYLVGRRRDEISLALSALTVPLEKLINRVRRQIAGGHCGEGAGEIIWRQQQNAEWEQIAALLSALSSQNPNPRGEG